MPREIQQILDAISQFWDSPVIQFGLRAIGLYIVVLWFAAAYWAFRDMQLRTANPILPYLAAGLIILFSPILFPFAIVAYKIVRPQEKIGEVYERTLAEEALLAEVEAVKSCPTCTRRVNDEWIICPTCRTRLNRVCPNCSRLVGLDWSLCAWCGRDFERPLAAIEPAAEARVPVPFGRREALAAHAEFEPEPGSRARDGRGRDTGPDRGWDGLPEDAVPGAAGAAPGAAPGRGAAPALARQPVSPSAIEADAARAREMRDPREQRALGGETGPRRSGGALGSVRRRQPGPTADS
jgi:RNA polymerase subunit RPABC4/transcription elongation factor Spt4